MGAQRDNRSGKARRMAARRAELTGESLTRAVAEMLHERRENARDLVPVSLPQAPRACQARHLDRHRHHAARLNFGAGFAYAPAQETGEPPPSKDGGFTHTDIEPALKD
jgi:uncharacterized protein with PIN domain